MLNCMTWFDCYKCTTFVRDVDSHLTSNWILNIECGICYMHVMKHSRRWVRRDNNMSVAAVVSEKALEEMRWETFHELRNVTWIACCVKWGKKLHVFGSITWIVLCLLFLFSYLLSSTHPLHQCFQRTIQSNLPPSKLGFLRLYFISCYFTFETKYAYYIHWLPVFTLSFSVFFSCIYHLFHPGSYLFFRITFFLISLHSHWFH